MAVRSLYHSIVKMFYFFTPTVITLFQNTPLLITTFAIFGLMVSLAWFKYHIAYKVDSKALKTDGKS